MGKEVAVEALRPFGTSIFTEMSVLANTHNAVNLSQGFPDFDGPREIRAMAADAILRGPNQYVLSHGIPELRRAVARKMKRFYGVEVDANDEVTVTSGATEGLCATFLGILEPGDELILLEPSYDVYPPEGSYYLLINITSLGFDDDVAFCRMLPEEAGVAAIPCSCFWDNRHRGRELVRFCFCKKDETLDEAIKRLKRWLRARH